MRINADFTQRAVAHADEMEWIASPMAGVERKMLDRIGGEVARATSLVRYAPNSAFSRHTHNGGEEFLVLEGIFQDEHGNYPVGTYVRNPPTTAHTPKSDPGCIILVKLHQFDPDDRNQFDLILGEDTMLLHQDDRETVGSIHLGPMQSMKIGHTGGAELLVLLGGGMMSGERMRLWSWLRLPRDDQAEFVAGSEGAHLWLKTGHLAHINEQGPE